MTSRGDELRPWERSGRSRPLCVAGPRRREGTRRPVPKPGPALARHPGPARRRAPEAKTRIQRPVKQPAWGTGAHRVFAGGDSREPLGRHRPGALDHRSRTTIRKRRCGRRLFLRAHPLRLFESVVDEAHAGGRRSEVKGGGGICAEDRRSMTVTMWALRSQREFAYHAVKPSSSLIARRASQ